MTSTAESRHWPLVGDTLPTWWWPLAIGWATAATAWLVVWLAIESTGGTLAAPGPASVREDATWPCVVVCAAWIAVLIARRWLPAGAVLLGLVSLGGLALVVSTMDRTGLAWTVVSLLALIAPGIVLTVTAMRHMVR